MRTALIVAQVVTYVGLGGLLVAQGEWRLGVAQLLLAVVQTLLFAT